MEQNRTKQTRSPQPGDLIEIFRPSGVYEHWAIYIGNGDVIHVAANGLGLASSSASFASAFGGTPTVKKEKLKIVVGDNSYQINNKYDHKYRPLPAKEIVEAALSRVGQKVDYDVFTNNCEHFVTLLRYGEPDSEQATQAEQMIGFVVAATPVVAVILGQLFSRQRQ
uniref:Retinoic acid receptor responder 3 n=1 Tax=Eptatretus burgeri TaxID=7764 RepID=A0A8C4N8H9_EPTBU